MLTEEKLRTGLINTARRWPNGVVPFVIDSVFSEYCSIKLQIGIGAWREISLYYEYRLSSSTHWSWSGRSKGYIYL